MKNLVPRVQFFWGACGRWDIYYGHIIASLTFLIDTRNSQLQVIYILIFFSLAVGWGEYGLIWISVWPPVVVRAAQKLLNIWKAYSFRPNLIYDP